MYLGVKNTRKRRRNTYDTGILSGVRTESRTLDVLSLVTVEVWYELLC